MNDADRPHTSANTFERPPRLIVAGFNLPDQSSHYFNELLGYKTAAEALGWTPQLYVPDTSDPRLATQLSANTVLAPRPVLAGFSTSDVAAPLDAFFDATESLAELWTSIKADDLGSADAILFPEENPVLIRAAGLWLADRSPDRRPSIFFRFVGSLLDSKTGRATPHTPFYRLASRDLRTRPGQERVFYLVNNAVMARTVTRVCGRRAFLMPMPKHLGAVAGLPPPAEPTRPTIYIHLNERSGRFLAELSAVIRPVLASDPSVRFLVKFTLGCAERAAPPDPDIASAVEVLAAEQDPAAYLENFRRCTLVLLAYEPEAYTAITSGVYSEAASFGKPVVAPAGTTMALDIADGRGAGLLFAAATPESVAGALIEALQAAARLRSAAREFAERTRTENTSVRFVERMIALARNEEDTQPRYRVGDAIDFTNYFDSRCFMRGGWGDTEGWGVWTVGPQAELELLIEGAVHGQPLLVTMIAQPFLNQLHRRSRVRVSAGAQVIADWTFELDDVHGDRLRTCEAVIPARQEGDRRPLRLSFAIEAPTSLLALGLSADTRRLGLGLRKLWISIAGATD